LRLSFGYVGLVILSQGCGISSHPKGGVRNKLNSLALFSFFFFSPPFFGTNMKTTSNAKTHVGFFFLKGIFLKQKKKEKKRGVLCHFTFKSILRQKKNYENSNISPCKNTNHPKKIL